MIIYGHDQTTSGLLDFLKKEFSDLFKLSNASEDFEKAKACIYISNDEKLPDMAKPTLYIVLEKKELNHDFSDLLYLKDINWDNNGYPSTKVYSQLNKTILRFYKKIQDDFPFDLAIYDEEGQKVWQATERADKFAHLLSDDAKLSHHIQDTLSPNQHTLMHNPSVQEEQYLVESYYKTSTSTYRLTIDLMPYLDYYLGETFQSIVGNSDATSSASITFFDEE